MGLGFTIENYSPSAQNSKPLTQNRQPQPIDPKPQSPNPKPSTHNSEPPTPNPKPQTPNLKPQTQNPKLQTESSNNMQIKSNRVPNSTLPPAGNMDEDLPVHHDHATLGASLLLYSPHNLSKSDQLLTTHLTVALNREPGSRTDILRLS